MSRDKDSLYSTYGWRARCSNRIGRRSRQSLAISSKRATARRNGDAARIRTSGYSAPAARSAQLPRVLPAPRGAPCSEPQGAKN